ncbi:MAG: hypothetical protein JWN07_1257 [Hyphomicrobiales bacterium]|nr:hypothetical protein [Hyphomicrobiales bacterium]
MVRAVSVFLTVMAGISVVSFCASAQDGAAPGGPLDLRPVAPKAAQLAGPFQQPAAKPAVKAKPKPKPASKPVALVPAKATAPQPLDRAMTGSTKAPVVAEKAPEKPAPVEVAKPAAEVRPPFDEYVVAQYCTALSSAASDGRLAWQAKRIEEMEARLRDRIAELEAKRAETADWLKKREDALRKADDVVVAIYSKMKPDAAAAQFSAMDESGAAAILSKLNPRAAGIVLNEIDASRAARIAAEMAGVGQRREIARSAP